MRDLYIRRMSLPEPLPRESYLNELPVVKHLAKEGIDFHRQVTFFVGENGSGKSTLIEALAVSQGFNPEGGTKNFRFSTEDSHSELCNYLRVARGFLYPRDGFFLRAESFYNVASNIDQMDREGGCGAPAGGRPVPDRTDCPDATDRRPGAERIPVHHRHPFPDAPDLPGGRDLPDQKRQNRERPLPGYGPLPDHRPIPPEPGIRGRGDPRAAAGRRITGSQRGKKGKQQFYTALFSVCSPCCGCV